jgi:hypothetical protein
LIAGDLGVPITVAKLMLETFLFQERSWEIIEPPTAGRIRGTDGRTGPRPSGPVSGDPAIDPGITDREGDRRGQVQQAEGVQSGSDGRPPARPPAARAAGLVRPSSDR